VKAFCLSASTGKAQRSKRRLSASLILWPYIRRPGRLHRPDPVRLILHTWRRSRPALFARPVRLHPIDTAGLGLSACHKVRVSRSACQGPGRLHVTATACQGPGIACMSRGRHVKRSACHGPGCLHVMGSACHGPNRKTSTKSQKTIISRY
jgi:hypothetical protein